MEGMKAREGRLGAKGEGDWKGGNICDRRLKENWLYWLNIYSEKEFKVECSCI